MVRRALCSAGDPVSAAGAGHCGIGATPTAVNQDLSKLRLAGLVEGRREGTYIHYVAEDEHLRRLLAEAFGNDVIAGS